MNPEEPMSPQALATLMHAEVEDVPVGHVDVARSMVDGLRERRRRQFAPALAALLVLGLGAGVAVITRHGTAPQTLVPGPSIAASGSGSASGTPSASPALAPERFDAERIRLTVGWMPDDYVLFMEQSSTSAQVLSYGDDRRTERSGTAGFADVILHSGAVPLIQLETPELPGTPEAQPAPETGLLDARWGIVVDRKMQTLTWRWASNAWVQVRLRDSSGNPGDRAIVERIARSVRMDEETPRAMPFTMRRPPAPATLISANANYVSGNQRGGYLAFRLFDDVAPNMPDPDGLAVQVTWSNEVLDPAGPVNRTIDGRPAAVHFESPDFGWLAWQVADGVQVRVQVTGERGLKTVTEADAIELARSVGDLRDPANPATWSPTPLR